MKTEAELQEDILVLWANLAAIIGGLGGLIAGDIDTEAKVAGKIAQVGALPQSSERDALLVALSELLSFYAGAGA